MRTGRREAVQGDRLVGVGVDTGHGREIPFRGRRTAELERRQLQRAGPPSNWYVKIALSAPVNVSDMVPTVATVVWVGSNPTGGVPDARIRSAA